MLSDKSNKIDLSEEIMCALIFARSIIRKFFGRNIVFKQATIYQENKEVDRYEVEIKTVIKTEDSCNPFLFGVVFGFTLAGTNGFSPEPNGEVAMRLVYGMGKKDEDLSFVYNQGGFNFSDNTRKLLNELRAKIGLPEIDLPEFIQNPS